MTSTIKLDVGEYERGNAPESCLDGEVYFGELPKKNQTDKKKKVNAKEQRQQLRQAAGKPAKKKEVTPYITTKDGKNRIPEVKIIESKGDYKMLADVVDTIKV